jgi:zinc protease
MNALRANLDASLELFADVALQPAFPEDVIARRKKQLLADIQEEKDSPTGLAGRVFPGLLYGKGHAYGNPASGTGTEASVAGITREDLERFHRTWFRPNNATLIVVGDCTMAELRPRLEKLFGGWQAGETPKKQLAAVSHLESSRVYWIDRPDAPQSLILAGHVAPPRNHPDEIAATVMNTLLGGKFTSRINMNLREEKHWSYGAWSQFRRTKGPGAFQVFAPVQTDRTAEGMAEVLKELRGIIREKPVTQEELGMTRDNMILELPGQRETLSGVVADLAELQTYGLAQDYFDTFVPKVRAVSRQDVSAVAEKLLRPEKLIWVVVGDRAKAEAAVKALNLGPIQFLDADGNPAGAKAAR